MNILMTADTVGGVWTYAVDLCRALAGHGVRVVLATKGAKLTPEQRLEVRALPNVELEESALRLEWMPDPWGDVERAREWLRELATRIKPDLVHLNDYAHGDQDLGCPKLLVGHSCVVSWWEAVKKTPLPEEWHRYHRLVRKSVAGAGAVVAPSRSMLRALERHHGPLRRARVVYNGRDSTLFRPAHKEPIILSAGRLWDEAKNVAALEAVAPALPWPVYLAGETAASTPEIGEVRQLGRLCAEALAPWFASASIYALPARYEPFGLSVLEAAQAGCALVLGDIDSLRELWDGAALFVPPEDAEALTAALDRLIARPALRAELARQSRMRALALTPRAMARGYLQLYRELLHPGASRAATEETTCAW